MWGKWMFVDISAPDKLVAMQMFSDAQGAVSRHPLSATWPLKTLATTTFTEQDGQTTLTLHYLPHEASAAEVASFAGLNMGWGDTFDQLEAYLGELATRS